MKTTLPEPLSLPWKRKPVSWAQSGSERLADGRWRFWIKEELMGITPEMLVWWFSHLEGDVEIEGRRLNRYRVWHSFDHVSVRYVHRAPDGFIGSSFPSLCHELLRKEAHRIQLQAIGEPKDHFLDADGPQLGQMVADRLWTADQRACGNKERFLFF